MLDAPNWMASFLYSSKRGYFKMNDYQVQTAVRFLQTPFRSMYYAVQGRGASALNGMFWICSLEPTADISVAQEKTYNDVSSPIPPNQWQIDVALRFRPV